MASIFATAYNGLGITFELFEIIFSTLFILLLLFFIFLLIGYRKRGSRIFQKNEQIDELNEEIKDQQSTIDTAVRDKQKILNQHEEALSKLKEAKEVILKQQADYKDNTSKFEGDLSKVGAMEGELKSYRLKIGDLNKEKEGLMSKYELDLENSRKDMEKLKSQFEKEKKGNDSKLKSLEEDFEEMMLKKERANEKRIDEIKSSSKDALVKLNKEKDLEMDDVKVENTSLKRQIEKLKEKVRVLEIEKL